MAVVETTFRTMASQVQVVVVDAPPQAGAVAQRALAELEKAWSRFIPTSDISRLNNADGQPITVNPATLRLIDAMIGAAALTDGRFAATVLPALMSAGYTASIENPSAVSILPRGTSPYGGHGLSDVRIDRAARTVALPVGTAIDPGGLGKGLAADLVVAELLARGAAGALISIGGDLAAAGEVPPQGWQIDVEDHLDHESTLTRVAFTGGGVATSSTRTRRWINSNTRQNQHHLIDPATNRPSTSDIVAATVVAPCGWQAEVHAKGVLLGGTEDFHRYTTHHAIQAVATTTAGAILGTPSFAEASAVGAA